MTVVQVTGEIRIVSVISADVEHGTGFVATGTLFVLPLFGRPP
jgi:hypothetical protein